MEKEELKKRLDDVRYAIMKGRNALDGLAWLLEKESPKDERLTSVLPEIDRIFACANSSVMRIYADYIVKK